MKPRALDLFCGAGGASMGLHRAGFDVTGVDIKPQPNYPFQFVQADALALSLKDYDFDFIWASPMCQAHTWAGRRWKKDWPNQIAPIRERLKASGLPYVIENVPGAPLINPIRLCGEMFGLGVIRHRLFESNVQMLAPAHKSHRPPIIIRGVQRSAYACVAGHGGEGFTYRLEDWREAMGIDWMSKEELVESIPPAYSTWIGERILEYEKACTR